MVSMVVLATVLFSTACKKDESSPSPTSTASGLLSATLNGVAFNPNDSVAGSMMNGMINISAFHNGDLLTISLRDTVAKTYLLEEGADNTTSAAAYLKAGASSAYTSNLWYSSNNKVVITKIDKVNKKISGTFTITVFDINLAGLDSLSFTSGSFTDVPYTTSLPPTAGGTFKVNIDGSLFAPSTATAFKGLGKISITGTNGSKSVGITVPDNVSAGTYALSFIGDYSAIYNPGNGTTLLLDDGSLTITNHSVSQKRIEGTFQFTCSDFSGNSAVLTNGEFSVSY